MYPINHEEQKYLAESIYEAILSRPNLITFGIDWQSDFLEMVQTKNPEMKKVFDKIRSVAPTKSTVLLIGETGAGKEVVELLDRKVRVHGSVTEVHGVKKIRVTSYEVLDK